MYKYRKKDRDRDRERERQRKRKREMRERVGGRERESDRVINQRWLSGWKYLKISVRDWEHQQAAKKMSEKTKTKTTQKRIFFLCNHTFIANKLFQTVFK